MNICLEKINRVKCNVENQEFCVTIYKDHSEHDLLYAEVIDLPGCVVFGNTMEELMKSIEDAIFGMLEVARITNTPIPKQRENPDQHDSQICPFCEFESSPSFFIIPANEVRKASKRISFDILKGSLQKVLRHNSHEPSFNKKHIEI